MKRLQIVVCAALALAGCATPKAAPPPVPAQPSIAIPPAPPQGEPQGYVDLPGTQLRLAFGHPAFVRHDGLSEMWRYDGAACRGFFFLYGEEGHAVVRHVETLPRGATSAADPACLSALRASPAKPSLPSDKPPT